MALNTSSLICAEAEEECLPLAPLPEVNGKPRHRRTLSQEDVNLKLFMATGTGRRGTRYGRSLPGSREYDPSDIEKLLKEIGQRSEAALTTSSLPCDYSAIDDTGNKREFRGGDLEKWKAGQEKWLERQEERAAKKRYTEQLAGKDADEGDANIALISAFNLNKPVLSFEEYLRDEGEKAAVRLLGTDLYHEISGDPDRLE